MKTLSFCPKCQSLNSIDAAKKQQSKICGKCQSLLPMHGLVSDVNSVGFQKIIKKAELPVIVDFWAAWCGPCKMYGPEFEKASLITDSAVFLKVDTEAEQALSGQLGIRGIPCTIVFKNGVEVKRQSGAMSADDVRKLLSGV